MKPSIEKDRSSLRVVFWGIFVVTCVVVSVFAAYNLYRLAIKSEVKNTSTLEETFNSADDGFERQAVAHEYVFNPADPVEPDFLPPRRPVIQIIDSPTSELPALFSNIEGYSEEAGNVNDWPTFLDRIQKQYKLPDLIPGESMKYICFEGLCVQPEECNNVVGIDPLVFRYRDYGMMESPVPPGGWNSPTAHCNSAYFNG